MITITLSEPEARALIQLMQLVVQRGCDINTAEAAIVISRRVNEAVQSPQIPKPNGGIAAHENVG